MPPAYYTAELVVGFFLPFRPEFDDLQQIHQLRRMPSSAGKSCGRRPQDPPTKTGPIPPPQAHPQPAGHYCLTPEIHGLSAGDHARSASPKVCLGGDGTYILKRLPPAPPLCGGGGIFFA